MYFDLVQCHVIQYGHQMQFQIAKINIQLTTSPKILDIFCSFNLFFHYFTRVLFSIIKEKITSISLFDLDPVKQPSNRILSNAKIGDYLLVAAILVQKIPESVSSRPSLIFYNMPNTNKTQINKESSIPINSSQGQRMHAVCATAHAKIDGHGHSQTACDSKRLQNTIFTPCQSDPD